MHGSRLAVKVFLTGFMAAGKSVVGRRLSRIAGVPFLDLDGDVENRAGMKISEIFAEGGEPAFRKLESAASMTWTYCGGYMPQLETTGRL